MLMSTALVVFMVPGLALFYGGMVRSRNVLNMLMMNMYCIGAVPIVWVLVSYSLGNSLVGLDQAIHAESAYNEGLKGSVVVLTPPLPSGR
jgi:Amt family ammonium transporter